MTSIEMPDATRHRICIRCGKWFEPHEGQAVVPEGRFAQNYTLGTGSVVRFRCQRCTRIRRATQGVIWGTFVALLGLVWLLQWLGVTK
jgi:RNase P subunit RPR2